MVVVDDEGEVDVAADGVEEVVAAFGVGAAVAGVDEDGEVGGGELGGGGGGDFAAVQASNATAAGSPPL